MFLATSFVGQHFRVYAYVFDNEDFTEKHCVNKDEPELNCNGACQMRKITEDEPTDSPSKTIEIKSVDLFLENYLETVFLNIDLDKYNKPFFTYSRFPEDRNSTNFPQPPDALIYLFFNRS